MRYTLSTTNPALGQSEGPAWYIVRLLCRSKKVNALITVGDIEFNLREERILGQQRPPSYPESHDFH